MLPNLVPLARRRLEGALCATAAPRGQPAPSRPCNTLPRAGGEGRDPPVSKCRLCNAETGRFIAFLVEQLPSGRTGIPIGASRGAELSQESVSVSKCAGAGDLPAAPTAAHVLTLFFFFNLFALAAIVARERIVMLGKNPAWISCAGCWLCRRGAAACRMHGSSLRGPYPRVAARSDTARR